MVTPLNAADTESQLGFAAYYMELNAVLVCKPTGVDIQTHGFDRTPPAEVLAGYSSILGNFYRGTHLNQVGGLELSIRVTPVYKAASALSYALMRGDLGVLARRRTTQQLIRP